MNYYSYSKDIDVYDRKAFNVFCKCVEFREKSYHRYFAIRWLAWYRVFHGLKDETNRKKQVVLFLEEIRILVKLRGY